MQATNVKLSAAEMALACDSEVLLTKNRIIEKIYALFGELSENYVETVASCNLSEEILTASPKISRGENYLGLPWVVLDYPRYFKRNNFFSVRTFFWWGNFFSLVFLVKGNCLALIDIKNLMQQSKGKNWLISTINDPWQHHISTENTLSLEETTAEIIKELIERNGFLKLQVKINIEDWDDVSAFMKKCFAYFLDITNKID